MKTGAAARSTQNDEQSVSPTASKNVFSGVSDLEASSFHPGAAAAAVSARTAAASPSSASGTADAG